MCMYSNDVLLLIKKGFLFDAFSFCLIFCFFKVVEFFSFLVCRTFCFLIDYRVFCPIFISMFVKLSCFDLRFIIALYLLFLIQLFFV